MLKWTPKLTAPAPPPLLNPSNSIPMKYSPVKTGDASVKLNNIFWGISRQVGVNESDVAWTVGTVKFPAVGLFQTLAIAVPFAPVQKKSPSNSGVLSSVP